MIPKQLRKEGLRFIRLRGKQKIPLDRDWQKTNNFPHDSPELQQHLKNNGNYGVATGYGKLLVVDFDDQEFQETIFAQLPRTFGVKTGSGGLHLYYTTDDVKSSKITTTDGKTLVDIQGEGKQVVGPGSTHPNGEKYSVLVDAPIATIERERLNAILHTNEQAGKITGKMRSCPYHDDKNASMAFYDDGSFFCFGCHASGEQAAIDNPEAKRKENKGGGKHYYIPTKEKKFFGLFGGKKDEDVIRTSFIEKNNYLIEQVIRDGKPQFCIYDKQKDKWDYKENIKIDGIDHKPIIDEEVSKGFIHLPTGVEEYGTVKELDEQIGKFIQKWLDIDEQHKRYAVYNIRKSWVYDKFHTLNYLRALGEHGTGKSRYLDTLGYLHYKAIATSGALTSAVFFRIIEKWKGSLIIDEADLKKSDASEDIIKIINQGYEKGRPVMRCNKEDGNKVEFFETYCPKIIATRKEFDDKATESRCMTHVMVETDRNDIPVNLNEDFFREAETIRNKLLLWRLRHYHKIDVRAGENIILEGIEPRLRQVNTGFLAMFADDQEEITRFRQWLREYQEEIVATRANSIEGIIVRAIAELLADGYKDFDNKMIIERAELTDRSGKAWTPRKLTKYLKQLGFKSVDGKTTKRVDANRYDGRPTIKPVPYEEKKLLRLINKYVDDQELRKKSCDEVTNVTVVTQTTEQQELVNVGKNVTVHPISHSTVTTVTPFTKLSDTLLLPCSICDFKGGCDYQDDKGRPVCELCAKEVLD